MKRNPYLSAAAHEVLKAMVDDATATEDDEDKDLTYFKPGGWWRGTHKVSSKVATALLRLCLIREDFNDGKDKYIVYEATAEAEKVLNDPDYVPEIVLILKEKAVTS